MNNFLRVIGVGAFIILCSAAVSVFFTGCGEMSAEYQQRVQTQEIMNEMQQEIGMPNIDNFFERKMAKMIFELRDDSELTTYTYIVNIEGKFVYLGRSVGYGLPYSVQYTSPMKRTSGYTLPQADPNGLYMPEGLSATWILMLDEETGEIYPDYVESEIVVSQYKKPRRLCAEWSLPSDY